MIDENITACGLSFPLSEAHPIGSLPTRIRRALAPTCTYCVSISKAAMITETRARFDFWGVVPWIGLGRDKPYDGHSIRYIFFCKPTQIALLSYWSALWESFWTSYGSSEILNVRVSMLIVLMSGMRSNFPWRCCMSFTYAHPVASVRQDEPPLRSKVWIRDTQAYQTWGV